MPQADPSLDEIAASCLLIQQTWSPEERLKRLRSDWRPTFLRADGVPEEMDAQDFQHHIDAGERAADATTNSEPGRV